MKADQNVPTGLCINNANCAINQHENVFPGTNIKFYLRFVVASSSAENPLRLASRRKKLFEKGEYTGLLQL